MTRKEVVDLERIKTPNSPLRTFVDKSKFEKGKNLTL